MNLSINAVKDYLYQKVEDSEITEKQMEQIVLLAVADSTVYDGEEKLQYADNDPTSWIEEKRTQLGF